MSGIRIVAVSDLLLDRPWPDLGVSLGRQRRSASEEALIRVVRHAKDSKADMLAVLGGLFDRRSVTPATLRQASEALDAFPGFVTITPGVSDWFDEHSPYAIFDWPERVSIFEDERPTMLKADLGVRFWGRAVTSPTPIHHRLSLAETAGDGANIGLIAGSPKLGSEERIDYPAKPSSDGFKHVISGCENPNISDPDWTGVGVAVPSILGLPQTSQAVLLEISPGGDIVNRELLDLGVSSLEFHDLDVSGLHTTASLEAALGQIASDQIVRLTGALHRAVLLPVFAKDSVDQQVHTEDLEYDLVAPRADDQTATAEFERRVLDEPRSDAEKHQAIALGLQALDQASSAPDSSQEAAQSE